MSCSHPQSARRRAGFTLVELLVVIGIIAVLISILLPTLASARRSANTVKCAASLKELGNAFKMYAINNKGYYPAVRDTTLGPPVPERRWMEYVAPYISSIAKDFKDYSDIAKLKQASVLWGCPEWTRSTWDASSNNYAGANVYNGYGMQYYPGYPEKHVDATNAYRNTVNRKGYIRESLWGRKGAERLLLADSMLDNIQLPPAGYTANVEYAPYNPLGVPGGAFTVNTFGVDSRHMKPGTPKKTSKGMRGINALFCDGHVASVSPKEAYNAIRSPGAGTIVPADVP